MTMLVTGGRGKIARGVAEGLLAAGVSATSPTWPSRSFSTVPAASTMAGGMT
jgi:NAD(P)-dependent dehydrogenase (short-subunit alcohol dehydrogenase family)